MLSYEQFKEEVKNHFMEYMSEQYKGMNLCIQPVKKINRLLDGLRLDGESSEKGINVSPTIYINDMYEHYMECGDLHETLRKEALFFSTMMNRIMDEKTELDFSEAKDNIVFQVVNTEQNREMLAEVPHREFQDLSIIYRWVVKLDKEKIHSALIENELAKKLGFNEEQLFKLAVENTKRIFPPCVKSMQDVVRELFTKGGMPSEIIDRMIEEMSAEQTMWVISNDRGINGAISMLYEENLHNLAMEVENDLYILPSSIHEVIAVSVSRGEPNKLAQMVEEINRNEVILEERLSNQVYHYDKDLRKLSLATDTPVKRLDVIESQTNFVEEEPQMVPCTNFRGISC